MTGMTGYDPDDGVFVWSCEYVLESSFQTPRLTSESTDPVISVISTTRSKRAYFLLQACGMREAPEIFCYWNEKKRLVTSKPLQQAMMLIFAGIASGRASLDILRPI